MYVLPALAIVVGIVYVGILFNARTSLYEWDGISPDPPYVGLENFRTLIRDEVFWTAMRNTAVFAGLTITVQMVLGFVIAVLVRGRVRGKVLIRAVIFVPVVLSPAIVGTTFRQILSADGEVNQLLVSLHLDSLTQEWLADPQIIMVTISLINIWQYTGFSFVVFDAALSQIDPAILDAARIDGAGPIRTVWSIIAPMTKGAMIVLGILGIISSLKTFDIVFLTTNGGPGYSSELLTTLIYKQAITQFNSGYASALSVVLVVLSMACVAVQVKLSQRGAS